MRNLNLFIIKNCIGIEMMDVENDPEYMEVNDFVMCERALKNSGSTCYVQAVLHALGMTRRLVLTFLMRDPFPFKAGSFGQAFKDFLIDQRELEPTAQSYEPLLELLAAVKHEPYANRDLEGDAHEAFYDITAAMINEESEVLNKKVRAEQKSAKMKKKDKYDLPYSECLQRSAVFSTFGFRMITMTACVKCKHVQRKLSFHLDL
jgi:ubiquitin C-terminal hydrolase